MTKSGQFSELSTPVFGRLLLSGRFARAGVSANNDDRRVYIMGTSGTKYYQLEHWSVLLPTLGIGR